MKQNSIIKDSQEKLNSKKTQNDFNINIQDLNPLTPEIIINQPTINISLFGNKEKGKTTLVQSLSVKLPSKMKGEKEPERIREKEKNISQEIGYINTKIYKCVKCYEPECYTSYNSEIETELKCKICGNSLKLIRHISFIDSPELNIKMVMLLNSNLISDGALVLVSADDKEIADNNENKNNDNMIYDNAILKNIIIVQNKIDLVMKKNNSAKEQYSQIKKFASNIKAQNSPIIPISAQLNYNLDILTQFLISIPIPKRDLINPPKFNIIHSFPFNHSLYESTTINKNFTLYGILSKGVLKLEDNIAILPGICIRVNSNETKTYPIYGRITMLQSEKNLMDYIIPGGMGNLGIFWGLDFNLENDNLEGNILSLVEKEGNIFTKLGVKCHLLRKLINIENKSFGKHLEYVTDIRKGELLLLNFDFNTVGGHVINVKGNNKDEIYFDLKKPMCVEISDKLIISRKIGNFWRIIGWGEVISDGEGDNFTTT